VPVEKRQDRPEPLSEAFDRLYGVPLDQFIALRHELSRALRASGELAASRQVAALAKPTRTVWGLNQVARRQPELLRDLFEARERAASAQLGSDAGQVRAALREYRDRVSEVVRAVRGVLADVGIELGTAQSRRIGETLQAASAGDSETRARLVAGRLDRDINSEDAVFGLEGDAPIPTGPRTERTDHVAVQRREAAARAAREQAFERERVEREQAIVKARQHVALLEKQAVEAHALAVALEASAKRAESAASHARRTAEQADQLLENARSEMHARIK
jgi:hypothetical protein